MIRSMLQLILVAGAGLIFWQFAPLAGCTPISELAPTAVRNIPPEAKCFYYSHGSIGFMNYESPQTNLGPLLCAIGGWLIFMLCLLATFVTKPSLLADRSLW